MKRSLTRTLGLVLALTLVAVGCGGGDDGDDALPEGDIEAPTSEEGCDATVPGTQIDYGVFAPARALDPPYNSGALVGGTELAAVYDVLFTFDFESLEFEPKLAESLEPNDDFTTWTLTLREGITYSDGTPLDAQLVSDNLDRFLQEGVINGSGAFLTPITEKRVVDDRTLEMQLDKPWPSFRFVFSDEPGMVVNLNAIGDDLEAFGAQPPDAAGLGPYVVERNAPGEELVMRARDDYWGGPVCVETLRFVFVPGASATYDAYRSGDIDIAFLRDPVTVAAARNDGEEGFFAQQDAGEMLTFNHREGRPTADPRVRKALMYAIDDEVINQRAYQGELTTSKSLVQPGSRFHSDLIEEHPTDADEARALLDEAKADGYDGSIELLCTPDGPRPETALATQSMLEAVGFDVSIRTLPVGEQIGETAQGNFDIACFGANVGPATGVTTFLRNFQTGSTTNRGAYSSEEMDAAIDDLIASETEEELQEAVAELNEINNDDAILLVYGAIAEGAIWKPEVRGVVPTTSTIFLFDEAYIAD